MEEILWNHQTSLFGMEQLRRTHLCRLPGIVQWHANMHRHGPLMDCDLQPADGRLKCSRCGWEHDKFVHRNCPVPPDPAVIVRRAARLAVCLARECSSQDPLAPYCLPMRVRMAATPCRARALLAAALAAEERACEWWPE